MEITLFYHTCMHTVNHSLSFLPQLRLYVVMYFTFIMTHIDSDLLLDFFQCIFDYHSHHLAFTKKYLLDIVWRSKNFTSPKCKGVGFQRPDTVRESRLKPKFFFRIFAIVVSFFKIRVKYIQAKLFNFLKELINVVPNMTYYKRKNYSLKKIIEYWKKRDFSALVVISEK